MGTITIRKEYFGYLIFSGLKGCYFESISPHSNDVICTIINNIHNGLNWASGLNQNYIKELKKLDFDNNIRYIDYSLLSKLSAPLEYYFDYTNFCNLKCPYCYNRIETNSATMPVNDIENIIDEMYQYGVMRLHLAGGEPLTDKKKLLSYLERANKHGIMTSIATNGTLIDKELCKILFSNNLFSISVSIDGYDCESHDAIRGQGNFGRVIKGFKQLVRYKKYYNSNTLLCVKPVYDISTKKDTFEKMINMAKELGADVIKFANPERCIYHPLGYYGSSFDKYYEKIEYIESLKKKYGEKIIITNVTNPIVSKRKIGITGMTGCIGAQELITINPDGNITPCLMNKTLLGNYYNTNSVMSNYRDSKKLNDYLIKIKNDECKDCSLLPLCRGGCQVRKIVEYGSIKNKDPLCPKRIINHFDNNHRSSDLLEKINVFHSL